MVYAEPKKRSSKSSAESSITSMSTFLFSQKFGSVGLWLEAQCSFFCRPDIGHCLQWKVIYLAKTGCWRIDLDGTKCLSYQRVNQEVESQAWQPHLRLMHVGNFAGCKSQQVSHQSWISRNVDLYHILRSAISLPALAVKPREISNTNSGIKGHVSATKTHLKMKVFKDVFTIFSLKTKTVTMWSR